MAVTRTRSRGRHLATWPCGAGAATCTGVIIGSVIAAVFVIIMLLRRRSGRAETE